MASKNIKDIKLLNQKEVEDLFGIPIPEHADGYPLATILFDHPVNYTILHVEDLLKLLHLWIIAEEMRYPQEKGFKGRWMLFEKIKEVFENESQN